MFHNVDLLLSHSVLFSSPVFSVGRCGEINATLGCASGREHGHTGGIDAGSCAGQTIAQCFIMLTSCCRTRCCFLRRFSRSGVAEKSMRLWAVLRVVSTAIQEASTQVVVLGKRSPNVS